MGHKTLKQYSAAGPSGTHRVGTLRYTYADIVRVFGQPTASGGEWDEKTTYEWIVLFDDGTYATIYDYKSSPLYDDPNASESEMAKWRRTFRDWSIGGRAKKSATLVQAAMRSKKNGKGDALARALKGRKRWEDYYWHLGSESWATRPSAATEATTRSTRDSSSRPRESGHGRSTRCPTAKAGARPR